MSHARDSLFLRFAGGAFAVFAGVALALAADDWRQGREEAREAEESLQLVASELRLDSLRLDNYAETMERHAASAAWLIERWYEPEPPLDSVEMHIYRFYVGGLLSTSQAAYEGLTNSNRLRLVRNEDIQSGIRAYYGRTKPSLNEFWEYAFTLGSTTIERLAPHFRQPMGETPGALWPYREDRMTIRHDWSRVTDDVALEATLHQYGVMAQYLAGRLITARDEATDLVHLIEASQPDG